MKKITWLIVVLWTITGPAASPRYLQTEEHQKHQQHEHSEAQQKQRDRDRWMWQLPQRVMNVIGVKPGKTIGEVGAGYGYFTFRLAKRVGKTGKIFANDIDEKSLNSIKKSIKDEGIANITTILGKPDDPLFPKGKLDMAIMVNVIHEVGKPVTFLQNMRPSFKPGATLVIVEWDAEKMKIEHPDMSAQDMELFSKEYVLQRAKAAGYEVLRIETFLPVQNIFICRSTK